MTAPTTTRPRAVQYRVRTRTVRGKEPDLTRWMESAHARGLLPEQESPAWSRMPDGTVQVRLLVRELVPDDVAPRPTRLRAPARTSPRPVRRRHPADFDWKLARLVGGGFVLALGTFFVVGMTPWGAAVAAAVIRGALLLAAAVFIVVGAVHMLHGPAKHCPGCQG